jgi:hypothetical protein
MSFIDYKPAQYLTTECNANESKEENCQDHHKRKFNALDYFVAALPDDSFHVIGRVEVIELLDYAQFHAFRK